ncbi:MAG: hypothetical protein WBE22_04975 [Halobacteriota archaeon]
MESEAMKVSRRSCVHCFFYSGGGIVVVDTCLAKMCHLHLHGVKQLSLDYPSPDRYSQIRWHLTPHRLNG